MTGPARDTTGVHPPAAVAAVPVAAARRRAAAAFRAAISLAGAITGFVLPLARAVTQSVSALDLVAWGFVALIVQIVVFFLVGKLVPRFPQAIKNGQIAAATLLAALAMAVGLLNAATQTT